MNENTDNLAAQNTEMALSGYGALATAEGMDSFMGDDVAGLEFSFDKVGFPTGGSTAFEIPDPDGAEGETKSVKELKGVIIHNHPAFVMYRAKYNGSSNPPDCSSYDGVHGSGNPGGECRNCPYNRFGSGEGQSKACKNKRMLYILQEGETLPIVLNLPTGSIRAFSDYVKRQMMRGRNLSSMVTKITLQKTANRTGISYSQAVFTFDRELAAEERNALAPVKEQVRQYAAGLSVSATAADAGPYVDPDTGEVIEPLN